MLPTLCLFCHIIHHQNVTVLILIIFQGFFSPQGITIHYRPPTNVREIDFFSHACLSVHRREGRCIGCHNTTWASLWMYNDPLTF